MILARSILFAGAAAISLAAGSAAPDLQARNLQVTVIDATGAAVANADICVDSARSGARLGEARSNAAGRATVPVSEEPAATPAGGPAVTPLRVTASAGSRGAAVQSGPVAMVTVRLPASGGPRCATGQVAHAGPGQVPIDRARLRERIAALPDHPKFESVRISMIRERCFGAAGMRCGDEFGQTGTCDPITRMCTVNVGSWKHDECCVRNPEGGMCGLNPAAPIGPGGISSSSTVCQADFNTAVARLATPMSWARRIDFARVNTTGTVEHSAYCAPPGTLMAEGEERYCCTGRVRVLASAERAGLSARVLAILPARAIRVCAA